MFCDLGGLLQATLMRRAPELLMSCEAQGNRMLIQTLDT